LNDCAGLLSFSPGRSHPIKPLGKATLLLEGAGLSCDLSIEEAAGNGD
jgi:hypothetical protein